MSVGLNASDTVEAKKLFSFYIISVMIFSLDGRSLLSGTSKKKKKKLTNLVTDGINFPTKVLVFRNSWKVVPAEISTIKLVLIPRF